MSELTDKLDKAFAQLQQKMPQLSKEKMEELRPTIERLMNRKDRKSLPPKEGFQGNPFRNSAALTDLSDLLTITKELLVPLAMQAEMQKMKNVANMIKSQELSQGLIQASSDKAAQLPNHTSEKLVESLSAPHTSATESTEGESGNG